jgi:hypothetical protein
MLEHIKSKQVKTRKAHLCYGCRQKIPPKTENTLCSTYADGTAYNLYFCEQCQKYIKKRCYDCDDRSCAYDNEADEGYIIQCQEDGINVS